MVWRIGRSACRSPMLLRSVAFAGVLAAGLAWGAAPALADTRVAVSTFDVERLESAGTTVVRTLRVSNLGDEAATLVVVPRGVELLDDGATRLRDGEDPRWVGRVTVAEPVVTLAGRTSRDVRVTIAIPESAPPDDYILGILVAAQPAGPGIKVVGEVGALLPVAVQGPRVRSLELVGHTIPRVVVGDHVTGTARVTNTGENVAAGWMEVQVYNSLTGDYVDSIQLKERTRIAPGLSRSFSYTWQAGVTAGKFRLPVRVSYNREDAITADLTTEEEVWLIHPTLLAGAGAGALALAGAGVLLTVRLRARGRVPTAHGALRAEKA